MGPALYSLYSADLIKEIAAIGVKIMAYADDLLLVTNDRFKLFRAMDIIFNWCLKNNAEVNKSKSGILVSKLDDRTPDYPQKHLRGIPVVDQYRYLGVSVSNTFEITKNLTEKRDEVQRIANSLRFLFQPCKDYSTQL